jgi:nitroimidazol reductase NimA-like FMN-containing flavoprotein (pyridoxamine 5'-phosphate oxidase superfamily)
MTAPSERTRVRRLPKRGAYDRATIDAILDAGRVAHVALVEDGRPLLLPMVYARDGDRLLLHGSPKSRLLRLLAAGTDVCVTVTLLDGLVLARSAAHHSMNYRSVMLFARSAEVVGREEKDAAFEAIVEHVIPGRWADCRQADDHDHRTTTVIAIPIEEVSAKLRTGGPVDEEADYATPHWAGTLPLTLTFGEPIPDERLAEGTAFPGYRRGSRSDLGPGRRSGLWPGEGRPTRPSPVASSPLRGDGTTRRVTVGWDAPLPARSRAETRAETQPPHDPPPQSTDGRSTPRSRAQVIASS